MSRVGIRRPTLIAVITLLAMSHATGTDGGAPRSSSSPLAAIAGYVATPAAPPVTLRAGKTQGMARSATSRSGYGPLFFLLLAAVAGLCRRRDASWTNFPAAGAAQPSLLLRRHVIVGRAPPVPDEA